MSSIHHAGRHWSSRLPFYYGWVIIAVAFVTMAIGVSARTAFSLLMPPLIAEFGWDRGFVAGAFSFGLLISAALIPGALWIDRTGPYAVGQRCDATRFGEEIVPGGAAGLDDGRIV